MEVWLPAAGWNGKLQVVGNGAFAGTISYPAMATALAAGYAAASTDTGHTGPSSNTFVNEDTLIDFAHRAVHETTAAAKQVINRVYGEAPKLSYFNGCSTGGRQALTAAQRYPAGLRRHRRRRARHAHVDRRCSARFCSHQAMARSGSGAAARNADAHARRRARRMRRAGRRQGRRAREAAGVHGSIRSVLACREGARLPAPA